MNYLLADLELKALEQLVFSTSQPQCQRLELGVVDLTPVQSDFTVQVLLGHRVCSFYPNFV